MNKFGKVIVSTLCIGAAFMASSAFADSKPSVPRSNGQAAAPWYERFTFGSEVDSGVNAWTPRGESKASLKFSPKSKWGVTFGMQEPSRGSSDLQKSQASAGAFYDFSKNFRVGGQVVMPQDALTPLSPIKKDKQSGPSVKVESAFRF